MTSSSASWGWKWRVGMTVGVAGAILAALKGESGGGGHHWAGSAGAVVAGVAAAVYLLTGGHYTMYLLWHTFGRDMRAAYRYIRLLLLVYGYQRRNLTVPQVFQETVARYPHRKCLIYEDKFWTFRELEDYSNRVAHFFLRLGYKHGDVVAIFMDNRPEYIGLWLGLSKIGVVPALINSNLSGQPLIHSINAASATGIIYGIELAKNVSAISSKIPDVALYHSGLSNNCVATSTTPAEPLKSSTNLDVELVNSSPAPVPESVTKCMNFTDKLFYIYTSGTTGLPKASVIKHSRFYFFGGGIFHLNNLSGKLGNHLVIYDPLPLYHSAGGIVGISLMMVFGSTVVIRKKFSVRNFWKECCQHECNVAMYIGETCRYLLSAPETPEEKQHGVQVMIGNGLRPQIWNQFQSRFNIKFIGEFYGATEGNSNVSNIDSEPGAVGFASVLFPFVYPVRLIKVDQESGDVLRNPDTGLCILCQPGEPGEFVGKIVKNHPSRSFDGYVDKAATEKKIVRDVLYKGDMWFRSGDLLTMDEFGWMYFVDRMGDTFRWRGENVSTIEVEAVVSSVLKQQDAIVYGVEVPGVEGRAGMAAVVEPKGGLDVDKFYKDIKRELPSFAIPLFIRIVEKLDITSTFKLKKLTLQREGYNPSTISDPMYFLNSSKNAYQILDDSVYNDIVNGLTRL